MESTPAREDKVLYDWFFAHIDAKNERRLPTRTPEAAQFVDYLWPSSLEYHSPLNPIFLAEIPQAPLLNSRPIWLARDGLIPLLWFFKTNPEPKDFKGKLWVNHQLAGWVPDAWRKITGTYEVESSNDDDRNKKDKLLLLGLVSASNCQFSHLEIKLAAIQSQLKKSKSTPSEIVAFLPPRFDNFGEGFYGEFSKRIFSALGNDIHFISWQEFNEMKSYQEFEVVEFNENLLCSDSFTVHHVLSKGARLFGATSSKKSAKSGEIFLQTSPHHGMRLRPRISADVLSNLKMGETQMRRAMLSSANHRFPWPKWFETWSKVRSN